MKSQIGATLAHVAFLEPNIHRQAEMLNQTVVNGWKSIYPVKEQSQKKEVPQRKSYQRSNPNNNSNYQKGNPKPNQFHNFQERNYDFDKLEQKLLNKQYEGLQQETLSGAQKEPALDLEP